MARFAAKSVGAPLGVGFLLPLVGPVMQNSLHALSLALLFLIKANPLITML